MEDKIKFVDEYLYCLRCGRKLRTPETRKCGMGKVCMEKTKRNNKRQRLFDATHRA